MEKNPKIFDLVSVVDKLENLKSSTIECFCYANTILCIGTSDGYILRYSINKSKYLDENVEFKSVLIDNKLLNHRKPINMLTIINKLQKILYLSESNLNLINFDNLESSSNISLKQKNVTTYCFNEKYTQESGILCVCVKGRTILVYAISDYDINFYKEITLPSLCLQMEMDKNFICIACDDCYLIVNIIDSTIQTLFPYNIEELRPFIAAIPCQGEFLLNCLGDLGMFAGYDGQTTRPPIAWCSNCTQFQVINAYVLCLKNDSIIRVYSLDDGKQKQEINTGVTVKALKFFHDENLILVSTSNQVYALNVLISKQVDHLLTSGRTEQAIRLFESFEGYLEKENFQRTLRLIKIRAGLIELVENLNFAKSESLLLETNIDYREIVKLVMPDVVKVQISGAFSNEEDNFRTLLSKMNDEKLRQIKTALVDLMLNSKTAVKNEEFVFILFKLCIDTSSDRLNKYEFFTSLPIKYCIQNVKILNESKLYHSVALINFLADDYESAFDIWKNLCERNLTDDHFPGFDFVIEQMSKCKDQSLVWKQVEWCMKIDQKIAVKIFTNRSEDELNSERMRVDYVVEHLEPYRQALAIYLEHLINVKNFKKEKYITQLIGIYLDEVIDLLSKPTEQRQSSWDSDLEQARSKLQNILEVSSNFRVQPILSRVKEYENVLQKECAILYEKIEEHEKALKIFVYSLNDYKMATNYCLKNSKDSLKLRKQLFNILFSIYLNPNYRDQLLKPALDLLNSKHVSNFDLPKLLDMIPNNWSMKLAGDFLQNALSSNLNKRRTNLVEKSIANNYRICLQAEFLKLKKEQLYVDDDSRCCKCHKAFDSTVLIRLPNGKLTHKLCKSDMKMAKFDY